MRNIIHREALDLFSKSQDALTTIITKSELNQLPNPVQRYLRSTGILGKKRIKSVRLKQKGFFRTQVDQPWIPLIAEQYFTTHPPAFLWFGIIKPLPFLSISGRDLFTEGRGNMLIKFLSLFTLVDARGPEIDQGALLRYLGEIMWFPTAWISDYIQWQFIDDRSVQATLSYGHTTVSVVLHFNANNQLVQIVGDRYREVKGQYSLDQWVGICSEYREVNGFQIPINAEALWKLQSGDFSYFRGEIVEIEYDCPLPY